MDGKKEGWDIGRGFENEGSKCGLRKRSISL